MIKIPEKTIDADKGLSKVKKQEEKKHTTHVKESGRVMPKRMQILKLQDELRKADIPIDTVDLEGEVDSEDSYSMNHERIMGKFKNVSKSHMKSKEYASGYTDQDIAYAAQAHEARPEQAKTLDNELLAQEVHTEKEIKKNPEILDEWNKNPGQSDIKGIDAFDSSKPRQFGGKGSIQIHTIGGNQYAYLHHREGNQVVADYVGRAGGGGKVRGKTKTFSK